MTPEESKDRPWSYDPDASKQLKDAFAKVEEELGPHLKAIVTDLDGNSRLAYRAENKYRAEQLADQCRRMLRSLDPPFRKTLRQSDTVQEAMSPWQMATSSMNHCAGHRKALQRARRPAILVRTDTAKPRFKSAARPIPGHRKAARLAARGY